LCSGEFKINFRGTFLVAARANASETHQREQRAPKTATGNEILPETVEARRWGLRGYRRRVDSEDSKSACRESRRKGESNKNGRRDTGERERDKLYIVAKV